MLLFLFVWGGGPCVFFGGCLFGGLGATFGRLRLEFLSNEGKQPAGG